MKQSAISRLLASLLANALLLCAAAITAQSQIYTAHPRDFASHRFLIDDGTGNGFFGIIRLNGTLTNHIYYDFPTNASGSFIFSNSSGGQTIAGGLAVTGGLTADMLSLSTPLAATSGGTGFSSYAVGDMLYANTTTSLARLPIGGNGLILTVSGGVPTWSNTASGLLVPFNQITNGTNTGQANLEVGAGSSLYPVGTGAITANRFVTSASATDAVDLATSEVSGVLPDGNVSNTLTITAGSVDGTPIGATTASTGRFTTITGISLPSGSTSTVFTMSNGGALETRTAASLTGILGVSTNSTLTGDGTSGNPLGVNLASANTWTATQTLPTTAGQGNALIASTNSGSTTINAARIGTGLTNTQVNDDLTISGGTVDNTPVGATTASTGRFTTITGTGLPSGSTATVFTMSNGGALETRTAASLAGILAVSTNSTLTGDGTSGNPLGVNLASANTWTATQTLPTTAGQGNALIASTNSGSTTINAVRIGAGLTDAQVNDNLTISGGTVDGTPVGGTTRSTGAFTTLGANGAVTLGDGNDNITLNAGSGIISASGDKLENVADPTAAQDAATKNYVDNQITSTAWLLGGNTSPSSNIFGTVSATDIDVRTGNATRMTVGSGGGIGINATPVSTTKLAVGTVDATGGIGVAVNMAGTTTSTGVKVTNVGATGANDAGVAISAASGGTGIGIRLGGGAGANLATGINITGGTGISYNAATAGTGTGISVGGTTRPATGGSFEGATVAVQAQSGATGNGVIASTATTPVAPPTGVALAGFSQNNTGNTTSRGVYGEAASSGSGAATTTLGAVGTANSTGGTNSGLSVGVQGTAAGAGNGTNAVVGGFFQTTGATGNRFAVVANGGGDVYLGSSDADRPASLTVGGYIGTGNTNTTYMNAIRSSGTAGTANVRMGSLSGAALTGTYTPTANDGIIVADNNGDLLKRSVSSTVASVSWALTGNTGTTAGTNFLGTTDAQAFEIHVDEGGTATEGRRRVMRFEPNANSANIIGGFNGNSVTAGAIGATISGGGANGATNSVTDDYGVVGGGQSNRAGDNAGATNDNQYATVSGGLANTASASYATVGGGQSNTASGAWSTVNGGFTNTASGGTATVGGGVTNTASAPSATVGGGESNMASAGYTAVGGGQGNTASASHATVSGGNGNTASDTYATVGGGFSNMAAGSRSAIPGGYGLTLDATADRSFGFHANNAGGSLPMTISAPDVAVFGNTDLWLANNDNNPSELRFFEAYNTAGAFPSGTNYTAFKAQTQANDITYTLPAANGSAGQVLQVASSPAPTATTATLEWGGGPGVLYNVSSQQATATPRTNHLFDVAYAAAAPDAASTGARISSSAGAAGNNNATALTLVATPTGTGTATALNATGNIVLATAASQISNSAGDVTVADNLVVNSGGATDLTIAETGLDRNSAATETFAITNSGTGDAALLVNGATSVTNSRVAIANGHVTSQQTTALSTGTLGAGVASATLSNATDVAGLLDITTNSAAATGAQATVSFSLAYGTAPIVVLTPANGPAAGIGAHISRTTGGFTVSFIGLPANTTSYQFFYHVIETQ